MNTSDLHLLSKLLRQLEEELAESPLEDIPSLIDSLREALHDDMSQPLVWYFYHRLRERMRSTGDTDREFLLLDQVPNMQEGPQPHFQTVRLMEALLEDSATPHDVKLIAIRAIGAHQSLMQSPERFSEHLANLEHKTRPDLWKHIMRIIDRNGQSSDSSV